MKRHVFGSLLILSVALLPVRGDDKKENTAATATPRDETWKKRHEDFVNEATKGGIDVLLLGDALTDLWRRESGTDNRGGKPVFDKEFAPLKAANFGMSGDRTQNLLWRVQNGELSGMKPKVIMLLIGTNNSNGNENTSAEIADGIKAIVNEIHTKLPETKILLLGLFPRQARADHPQRAKLKEVNAIIAKLDDGKTVKFLDIGSKFLEKDGSISPNVMPNYVHLSTKGYQIWADAVKGPIRELMGKK